MKNKAVTKNGMATASLVLGFIAFFSIGALYINPLFLSDYKFPELIFAVLGIVFALISFLKSFKIRAAVGILFSLLSILMVLSIIKDFFY